MGNFAEKIAESVKDRLLAVNQDVSNALVWQTARHASSPFIGATTNKHGDITGTNNPYTIFTVTGDIVILGFWGVVNTSLTGASGTIEVGVTGNTASIIAQETATEVDAGGILVSATQAVGVAAAVGSGAPIAFNNGLDIIETVATTDIAAGQIDYYVIWAPVEPGASLVSAAAIA